MSASKKPSPKSKAAPKRDAMDETKRKFREALAAKEARQGEDHIDNEPSQVHAHGPVESKRTFRRKTG